jgi:CubicO group peptidase (beta-lactamase class C family)
MVKRRLVVLLLFLATGGVLLTRAHGEESGSAMAAQVEERQSPNRRELDSFTLQEIMQKYRVPGVSVAVISGFRVHWAKGYGVADVESDRRVDVDTRFQAASISKPVAAMAVLKAVQNKRLALDADVNRILKSWKVPDSDLTTTTPVTPRALLSHTSGAGDGFGFPGYHPSQVRPSLVQILQGEKPSNVGPVFFERPPFTGYKYSGGGFVIMQLALMEALRRPFAEILRESVLDPLNMAHSTYEQPLPAGLEAKAARAHGREGQAMDARWHIYPEQAAAGLWTTPADLAAFVVEIQRALRGPSGRVLSQGMAREMVTPVGIGPFGLGLVVSKHGEGWYFSHGGINWGFHCAFLGHVRRGYGVVVMTNGDGGTPVINEIEARVAAVYRWDSLDKPIPR